MRRFFGLPHRVDPAVIRHAPVQLRVGAGDMLSWAGRFAQVDAVVSIADRLDVCSLHDGIDTELVVFDEADGRLWELTVSESTRLWPLVAEAAWPDGPVRVRCHNQLVQVECAAGCFVADLSTTGSLADWINAYGRPSQRTPGLELGPYITEE